MQTPHADSDSPPISWNVEPHVGSQALYQRSFFRIVFLIVLQNLVAIGLSRVIVGKVLFVAVAPAASGLLATLVLATCASIIAFYMAKQLVQFPGSTIAVYFPLCVILNFLLLAFFVVVFRLDYSRVALVCSLFGALIWIFMDYNLPGSRSPLSVAVVPNGNLRDINNIPKIQLSILEHPIDHPVRLDLVVADLHHNHDPVWETYIAKCVLSGIPVFDVKGLIERMTGRVEIEHLSENSFGALLPSKFYLRLKFLIDVSISVLFLPLVVLIIFVATIFIKFEAPGPVLFTQTRIGYRGYPFVIYKLRSMKVAVTGSAFTAENDNRITKVGAFIRKYRIDELPQIINVLRGEMSWIGPRPEAEELSAWYAKDIPYYIYRHAVRPGVTGWAQVIQGNVAEIDEVTRKLHYDFYYLKNFSAYLDLLIVFRTVYTLFSGFGAK
jgi:lipopolysaccharide/colanic/teichoic acid biosynthesis glycosyltransferase